MTITLPWLTGGNALRVFLFGLSYWLLLWYGRWCVAHPDDTPQARYQRALMGTAISAVLLVTYTLAIDAGHPA